MPELTHPKNCLLCHIITPLKENYIYVMKCAYSKCFATMYWVMGKQLQDECMVRGLNHLCVRVNVLLTMYNKSILMTSN